MKRTSIHRAHAPIVIGALALAGIAASAGPAHGQCVAAAADAHTKFIYLKDNRGGFPVYVHKDMIATIELPDKITRVVIPKDMRPKFWEELSPDHTGFAFKPRVEMSGRVTTIKLIAHDKADVSLYVRVVDKAEDVEHTVFRVRNQTLESLCTTLLAPFIEQAVTTQRRRDTAEFEEQRQRAQEGHDRELRERDAEAQLEARKAAARVVLERARLTRDGIPLQVIKTLSNPRISVRVFEPGWNGDEFLIPFELKNDTGVSFDLTEIQANDEQGEPIAGQVLALNVADRWSLPVTVPDDRPVRGVLALPSVTRDAVTPLRLSFMATGTKPTVVMAARWYPADVERIDQERRMSRTSVSVGPVGGVMWLADGANQNLLEPVGLGGLAVRIQKGYYWGGALEATIMGGRTGQARFDAVDWDGTEGTVTRSATIGRVLGGVAMRFGDRYMFVGRTGLGFQGGVNNARFTAAANNEIEGPGDGFAFDMLLYGGAGLELHLGEHWTIGTLVDGGKNIGGDSAFLQADLHVRYGWNP